MKNQTLSFLSGALCMLLLLCLVRTFSPAQDSKIYTHIDFQSELPQEDCFLCGTASGLSWWGEDNVGVLDLNTFELLRLEINRYTDQGERIETPAGYSLSGGITNVHAWVHPDDAFSTVQISNVSYSIDRNAIQSRLCQSCLDSINTMWFSGTAPAEYAVVSFSERTVAPLLKNTPWFSAGNYGIHCDFNEDATIDLLIHYLR